MAAAAAVVGGGGGRMASWWGQEREAVKWRDDEWYGPESPALVQQIEAQIVWASIQGHLYMGRNFSENPLMDRIFGPSMCVDGWTAILFGPNKAQYARDRSKSYYLFSSGKFKFKTTYLEFKPDNQSGLPSYLTFFSRHLRIV